MYWYLNFPKPALSTKQMINLTTSLIRKRWCCARSIIKNISTIATKSKMKTQITPNDPLPSDKHTPCKLVHQFITKLDYAWGSTTNHTSFANSCHPFSSLGCPAHRQHQTSWDRWWHWGAHFRQMERNRGMQEHFSARTSRPYRLRCSPGLAYEVRFLSGSIAASQEK